MKLTFLLILMIFILVSGVYGAQDSVEISLPEGALAPPNSSYTLVVGLKNNLLSRDILVVVSGPLEVTNEERRVSLGAYKEEDLRFVVKTEDIGSYSMKIGISYGKEITIKEFEIRVSGIVEQMKGLLDYYSEIAGVMRSRVTTKFYLSLENAIEDAQDSYVSENYSDLESRLEDIRVLLEDTEISVFYGGSNPNNETVFKKEDSSRTGVIVLGVLVPVVVLLFVLVIVLSHLGKTFIRARPKTHKELKKARSSVKKKDNGNVIETDLDDLAKRIALLTYTPKLKDLHVELELIRRKHREGMYRMCKQYMLDLKEKLEKMESGRDKQ